MIPQAESRVQGLESPKLSKRQNLLLGRGTLPAVTTQITTP